MRLAITLALSAIALTGCTVMDNQVKMDGLQKPYAAFLVDKTHKDSYPTFLAAEGNDLSCRYGIHYESASEFSQGGTSECDRLHGGQGSDRYGS